MLDSMIPLDDLGVVRLQGSDALRFLQGQLSNDVMRLAPQRALLAGYHNPQGRTIALLRLIGLGPEDILAILPRELAPAVSARLAKFVLRAKVRITDQSAAWSVAGILGPDAALPDTGLADTGVADGLAALGTAPERWLSVVPAGAVRAASSTAQRQVWHRLDIEAGLPQVFAATSEEFVAQMLNLDVLEAISFDKGCYTGQEVIARAHYRGRVKRRLQRFVTRGPSELTPGSAGRLSDGRPFKVVDAVALEDGRREFLAVAPLAVQGEAERAAAVERAAEAGMAETAGSAGTAAGVESAGTAESAAADGMAEGPVEADQLPLPYVLPE